MTVLTADMIEESLHAKAMGGYNLHMISLALDLPLEHFVFFSSISAMVGNAGQASYGAANVYLDALADYRRHQGLAGSSIAWGPIGEVGMVARDAQVSRMLAHKGIAPLSLTEAFDNFYNILSFGHCHTGCFNVDWDKWQKAHATSHEFDPVFGLFKVAEESKQGHTLIKRLLSVNPTDHESLLCQHLAETLAHVLHIDQNLVALDKPISELGVDSLMSIEFQLSLEAEMGNLNIPLQLDIQKTLKELALSILSTLNEHGALSEDAIDLSERDEPIHEIDVDGLSDDEVERMLAELLSHTDAH
jgi:acyl carrier protein